MRVKLNSWYTIGAVLIAGYVLIFVSVIVSQHSSDEFNRLNIELQDAKQDLIRKSNELKIIKAKNDVVVVSPPSFAPIKITTTKTTTMTHDYKIKTHGVIILGMHRSGTSIIGGLMNKWD